MKQGFLSAMATIGYGLVGIVVVLAVALGIMIGVKGIGPKDETISGLGSATSTTQALAEEQDVFVSTDSTGMKILNVSTTLDYTKRDYTEEEQERLVQVVKTVVEEKVDEETGTTTYSKLLKMKITGKVDDNQDADYSSQKVRVVLTKSANFNDVVGKTETPVLFVSKNAEGEEVLTTSIVVQVNEEFSLKILTYNAVNPYTNNTSANDDEQGSLEKEYILGGSVFLMSRSTESSLKSDALKIQVDVPIETLIITAQARDVNGNYVDVTNLVRSTANLFDVNNILKTNETVTESWDKSKIIKFEGNTTAGLEKDEYYYYKTETSKWESIWTRSDAIAFIKNTEIKLGVKTFPENAIRSVAGMNKESFVEFSASTLNPRTYIEDGQGQRIIDNPGQYDADLLKLGIFKIYAETTANTGNFPVEAKMPKLFKTGAKKDYTEQDYISADNIVFRAEPLKIESIEIGNRSFVESESVSVDVYGTTSFSATQISSLIPSLDIKIKSKHFVWGEDPSQTEISNLLVHEVVSRNFDQSYLQGNYYKVFNITSEESFGTKIWTLENIRNYLNNVESSFSEGLREQVDLYFSVDPEFNEFSPYAHLRVKIVETLPTNFEYAKKDINGKVEVDMIKQDAFYREVVLKSESVVDDDNNPIDAIIDSDTIFLDTTTENKDFLTYNGMPTYTKWVYFANPDSENKNEVGSKILNLTKTGQIVYTGDNTSTTYSERLDVFGDGEMEIAAFLVLTDKNGTPIDCFYKPITNSDQTGFVFLNAITKEMFETIDTNTGRPILEGNFVVVYCPTVEVSNVTKVKYCTIDVVEELSTYAVFYDDREGDEEKDEEFSDLVTAGSSVYLPIFQDSNKNNKTMFVVANSSLALENVCNLAGLNKSQTGSLLVNYFYGIDNTKENEGKVVANNSYVSPASHNFAIRYIPLKIRVMGSPKNDIDVSIQIIQKVSQGQNPDDFPSLTLSFNVVNVKVDSINVDYGDYLSDDQTEVSYEDYESQSFDTIKVKAEVVSGKPVWTFKGTTDVLRLSTEVSYTYNILPEHDYKNIEPSTPVSNYFKILTLTNRNLLNFASNPTSTYDDENFLVQVEPIYVAEQISGLRLVLKPGWEKYLDKNNDSNFRNIVLFYSARETKSKIVQSKFFYLDMSDCVDGVIEKSGSQPTSRKIYDASLPEHINQGAWTYENVNSEALDINLNEISVLVTYSKPLEEGIIVATLDNGFNMTLNLANGYGTSNLGTIVFAKNDEFTVTLRLFKDEFVVYEYEYLYQNDKAIYKLDSTN